MNFEIVIFNLNLFKEIMKNLNLVKSYFKFQTMKMDIIRAKHSMKN